MYTHNPRSVRFRINIPTPRLSIVISFISHFYSIFVFFSSPFRFVSSSYGRRRSAYATPAVHDIYFNIELILEGNEKKKKKHYYARVLRNFPVEFIIRVENRRTRVHVKISGRVRRKKRQTVVRLRASGPSGPIPSKPSV